MASFWIQKGKNIKNGNQCVKLGDLVKPFGRKYKGMWRIFSVDENGQIMLVSDECIGELTLLGLHGYLNGIDQLNQLCIDTVRSSKVTSVRSINSLDFTRICTNKEGYEVF